MTLVRYRNYRPQKETRRLINKCNEVLHDFSEQGYQLTLRQLFYQLVASDVIPNSQDQYRSLGETIQRAREGGLVSWDHIVDRSRSVREFQAYQDPEGFLAEQIRYYARDLWQGQPKRVFVFVEKQALEQVVGKACRATRVPYFANKGYVSASSLWDIAHNTMMHHSECNHFVVLHLGDHDCSGIDMTRDLRERLKLYSTTYNPSVVRSPTVVVDRIALNMDQISKYDPPPNPAKETDSRYEQYKEEYGEHCWELDALRPQVIAELIQKNVQKHMDSKLFEEQQAIEEEETTLLAELRTEMPERIRGLEKELGKQTQKTVNEYNKRSNLLAQLDGCKSMKEVERILKDAK